MMSEIPLSPLFSYTLFTTPFTNLPPHTLLRGEQRYIDSKLIDAVIDHITNLCYELFKALETIIIDHIMSLWVNLLQQRTQF